MGRHLACSQTLYFLFKIHWVCVIQNRNHGGLIDHQCKGLGVGGVFLAHLLRSCCCQCFWKERKEKKTSVNRLDAFSRSFFVFLWMPIAQVWYIKILTWLQGFLAIIYIWFGFLCAQVSFGNCETMESWKICNFHPKAWEFC